MSSAMNGPDFDDDDPGISGMGADWESSLPWNAAADPQPPQDRGPGRRRAEPARPRKTRNKPAKTRSRTPSGRSALAVAAALIVVAAAAFGVRAVAGDGSTGEEATKTSAERAITFGRPTPPGWSSEVAWRADAPLSSDVAVGDDKVLYIASSGSAVVLDATTGDTLFSTVPTNLGGGDVGVAIVGTPAGPTAVAWGSKSITAWPISSKGSAVKGETSELPPGATVFVDGGGLMVIGRTGVWTLDGRGLVKVKTPPGAAPLAALADGSLVAAPPAGPVTTIPPSGKPKTIRLKMADGATGDTMYPSRSAGGVIVAWAPTKADEERVVAFYRVQDGTILAQGKLPTDVVNQGLPLAVAPDSSLASAGPLLADLATGRTMAVDGWSATIAVQNQLYGAVSGTRAVWRGEGKPENLADDTAIPWGVISKGLAIVTEQVDGQQTLNGLVSD